MKKKYITYLQNGKVKKAVLDEVTLREYQNDTTIFEITEYDNEMLLERRYAEKIGVSKEDKKTLLG